MHRFIHNNLKLGAIGLSCAALGAGAGAVASAGATTTTAAAHPAAARIAPRALARHTVHGDLVLATKHGFVTVTVDRGFVRSVSGDQLTLADGTRKQTYKTVQLTLPAASTRVRDNGQPSTLAQLTQGERAIVLQAPNRAWVVAHSPAAG